jgi:hypothetical protein
LSHREAVPKIVPTCVTAERQRRVMKIFTRAAFRLRIIFLFPRETTLFAQRFEPAQLAAGEGEPLAVAEEMPRIQKNGRAASAASENGVLGLPRLRLGSFAFTFAWYDRQGKRIGAVGGKVEKPRVLGSLPTKSVRLGWVVHAKRPSKTTVVNHG